MESHSELQVKLSDAEQKISKLQEEFTTERDKLAEEIQLIQEQSEKSKVSYSMGSISEFKARCSSTVNVWRVGQGSCANIQYWKFLLLNLKCSLLRQNL